MLQTAGWLARFIDMDDCDHFDIIENLNDAKFYLTDKIIGLVPFLLMSETD